MNHSFIILCMRTAESVQDYRMLFIIYINVMIINYTQCKRKSNKMYVLSDERGFFEERLAYAFIQKGSHMKIKVKYLSFSNYFNVKWYVCISPANINVTIIAN